MKDIKNNNYLYSGGLAEIVSQPSFLTYSFFNSWLTGKESLGKAMDILKLPHQNLDIPLLEFIEGELFVNLKNEEKTLYGKTIFSYLPQRENSNPPHLSINFSKLINPIYIINTLKILISQSLWIAFPGKAIDLAKSWINTMPYNAQNYNSIKDLDRALKNQILPTILAIGSLAEFYEQLLQKENEASQEDIQEFIGQNLSLKDWFFRSLKDQEKVKNKEITLEQYLKDYGFRADKDYELNCPRWHENLEIIEKRIREHKPSNKPAADLKLSKKTESIVSTIIEMQTLRSEAKRKALPFFDKLRQLILKQTSNLNIVSRNSLLGVSEEKQNLISLKIPKPAIYEVASGKGRAVSKGTAKGTVKHIKDNFVSIPKDSICIFPNASPEFAPQYTKCEGIIFLKGGQTSHGAIVAREYGTPALVDEKAAGIEDGREIFIDGEKGTWILIKA